MGNKWKIIKSKSVRKLKNSVSKEKYRCLHLELLRILRILYTYLSSGGSRVFLKGPKIIL